jgi:hypothetical protein
MIDVDTITAAEDRQAQEHAPDGVDFPAVCAQAELHAERFMAELDREVSLVAEEAGVVEAVLRRAWCEAFVMGVYADRIEAGV